MSEPDKTPTAPENAASVPPVTTAPGAPSPQGLRERELRTRLRTATIVNVILGVISLGLLIAVILLALRPTAVAAAPESTATSTPTPTSTPSGDSAVPLAEQVARRTADDPMAFGDIDAPITIVEWVDYRCPFCAKYTNETMPAIIADYVDTGAVRYEVHDVSFFGEESTAAAVAARAAAAQGRFGEFLRVLYAAAPASGHPDMPRETLVGFAQEAGVPDIAAFTAALDDPSLAAEVTADTARAQQMGVTSVPFFVIGDEVLSGALPEAEFRKVIDAQSP
ncbi:DsbA family protein [Microbacterium sp. ZW T5_56]|uniref:DsbA family protein n=1 Tax=Microbacterium sp. ZW T5_56 TaxID=3378081 RepID=UPI003855494B